MIISERVLHLCIVKLKRKIMENVKNSVKEIINGVMNEYISYEWSGSDFSEKVSDESGVNVVETEPTMKLDKELYEKFVNHLTEVICSGLSEE